MMSARNKGSGICSCLSIVVAGVLSLYMASGAWAVGGAFEYDAISDEIVSASFSVDFAAMNAHRAIDTFETNFVHLIDLSMGLGACDVSDELFGAASPPDDPLIDMGLLETGIFSADIDSSFFPALAGGSIGLEALFTDTLDGLFAIDFVALTIETSVGMVESYYGWPEGNENNGFGLDIPDGGDLPDSLPDSLPVGSTGTGFDETISSKSIRVVPEPGSVILLMVGGLGLLASRWKPRRS
ncbi:MAG: PEP-CTERM sorting domain-containing protein [Phycisphaerae bacterium]|nr:PEP-CTERM sorting domain-containing protein [Phycisphaerae bacterium]